MQRLFPNIRFFLGAPRRRSSPLILCAIGLLVLGLAGCEDKADTAAASGSAKAATSVKGVKAAKATADKKPEMSCGEGKCGAAMSCGADKKGSDKGN